MEITFFKVIRNKILFKKIMGYINDEILHLELMIKNNRIELIMKSVFKREPLLFSSFICDSYSWSNDTNEMFENLFTLVNIKNKDQQIQQIHTNKEIIQFEIQSFYESFFQQYQNQLDFKQMLKTAIVCKNLKAVQVILDNGYFKLTNSQFIKDHLISRSFRSISLKMVKYVFRLFGQFENGYEILKEIKYTVAQVTFHFSKFQDQNKFKIINYLLDQEIILRETISDKKYNIVVIPVGFFDDDPFYNYFTVVHLMNAIKLYSSDKLIGSLQNSMNNFDQIKYNLQDFEGSLENSFSKQELKTSIKKLILKDDKDGTKFNGNLKLLLDTYQLVIKKPMVLKYLKYEINDESLEKRIKFKNQIANNLSLVNHRSTFLESRFVKQSLKYGNLDYLSVQTNGRVVQLEDIYKSKKSTKHTNHINRAHSKTHDVLFKHCKQFVGREYFEKFIDETLFENGVNSLLMDVFTLVCQLIEFNDVPLLEYSFEKHKDNIVSNLKKKSPSIQNQIRFVSSITSIEMLDYCWTNADQYFKGLFTRVSIASCYETGRVDLLSKYEQLICVNQKPLSISDDGFYFKYFTNYSALNGNILKTICYMIGKPELYDTSSRSIFNCIERSLDKHLYLDEIKFIISKTTCEYYPHTFNIPNDSSTKSISLFGNELKVRLDKDDIYLKMVKWIYNNRMDDILKKRFKIHYSNVLFQIGKFDLFLDQPIEPNENELTLISKEIVRTNNRIGVLKLFEMYTANPSKYLEPIKLLIIGCCQYGRLNILKYIFNNHFTIIQNTATLSIDTFIHTACSFGNFNILEYIMLKLNIKEINESFLKSVPSNLNFNYLNKT